MQGTLGVYIDGFNLYYGALAKRANHRWLDLQLLVRQIEPNFKNYEVNFFSAHLRQQFKDDLEPNRHSTYLNALVASGVKVKLGYFRKDSTLLNFATDDWAQAIVPAPRGLGKIACILKFVFPSTTPLNQRKARVLKLEEKATDVNLATQLLADAFNRKIDAALVISGDADLASAINETRNLGIAVTIANPDRSGRVSRLLLESSDKVIQIRDFDLNELQMPTSIVGRNGRPITRPRAWT
ncbi:MAG: NYN domain-containing protein [Rhodoluna sp.]|nr:NYN domain-containing protein [Rhodoluna sp.]MBP6187272.1 NYN domain-containing protein [Rhodoluna sp.]